jgi:hypothetical protein
MTVMLAPSHVGVYWPVIEYWFGVEESHSAIDFSCRCNDMQVRAFKTQANHLARQP